jgi:hypothetical protein
MLELSTVLGLGGAIIVPFSALAGCLALGNGGGGDDVDGDGGDNDDGDWPVDGLNGVFCLYCAKAMLIQLTIDAIQIATSTETKKLPIIL